MGKSFVLNFQYLQYISNLSLSFDKSNAAVILLVALNACMAKIWSELANMASKSDLKPINKTKQKQLQSKS